MSRMHRAQAGVGHIGLIVIIVVIAVAGLAGWWVWHNNQQKDEAKDAVSQAVADAIKNAKCDYDDKDLCKFFTGWKAQENYSLTSTSKEADGAMSTSVIETSGPTKSHMKLSGQVSYETILIGDTLYTKADDVWYKQTIPKADTSKYTDSTSSTLPDPAAEDATAPQTTYKKIGKEKCGEFMCFKYQVVEAESTGTTYLWFDDEDYQLRRTQTVNTDGSSYDATYSYKKVTIAEPGPVKELQPGQYLLPGQNEPVTLPSTGDTPSPEELQQLLDQYNQ